jgi:outer membrane protein assembly factor BamA
MRFTRTTPVSAVLAGLVLACAVGAFGQGIPDRSYKSLSVMPILMYDNDIGVGYGAKAKFVDYLGKKESFDLILFNSSKGERWYVFTFSLPDIEIRQGKTYPLSFDFKAEYDKYLKYNFYGFGPNARAEDVTVFTHEMKSLQFTFGRGITPEFVVSAVYNLRWLNYGNVEADKPFTDFIRQRGAQFVPFASLILRYDTSDSQIHPTKGVRFFLQDDIAGRIVGSRDSSYNRLTLDLRKYTLVFGDKDVFAVRAMLQYVSGSQIPIFDMSSLGGGSELAAMRGYALNRFLDKGKFLANIEYRFPIFWRLGGNLFVDTGTVWPSLDQFSFKTMAIDYGVGLRLYLPDFVVRVDFGFSKEGTRLYFNFGHIF